MDKEQTIAAIKVMQHFVDGGRVRNKKCGNILQIKGGAYNSPVWDWVNGYEIVPEPIERWVGVFKDGSIFGDANFETKTQCLDYCSGLNSFDKATKLVEEQE